MKVTRSFAPFLTVLAAALAGSCGDATAPAGPLEGRIAFTSIHDRFMRIYIMNADGTGERALTADGETNLEPDFSPDGTRIAFTSWRDGDANIYVMGADGSDPLPLTRDTANDRSPRFSPDGTRIAFVSQRSGDYEVWVMNADGSDAVNASRSPSSIDLDPEWSPDGTRVLFCSTRGGTGPDAPFSLWSVAADGSDPRRIPVPGDVRSPAYAPDGLRIAYVSPDAGGEIEIWVARPDGSGVRNLSNAFGIDEQPRWSPDGTRLVFSTNRDGSREIYVVRADGRGALNLTRNGFWDAMPDWSR